MPKIADALLMFVPEQWGQVDRFIHFYEHTYSLAAREKRAIAGVRHHFEKAVLLIELSAKLRPNLEIDREQLNTHGFTPAANAREIGTVIEAGILELYSTLDCTVKALRALYGKSSQGFKDSTRAVLEAPHKITGAFPEALKTAIADARWTRGLMYLRDELTHLAAGAIHLDHETGLVRYDHRGLTDGGQPYSIPDIYAWLQIMVAQVNGLVGLVFHHLNQTLTDREQYEVCGMVQGRFLHRFVSPVGELSFNSGRCGAWIWFEQPENPTCPFTDHCGAYQRKAFGPAVEPSPPPDATQAG